MKKPTPDFLGLLRTLVEHRVDFIVIGGVGAVLQGEPVATFDLDLLHSRDPENVNRILSALKDLDARVRSRTDVRMLPDESHLMSPGHQLLMTRCGPLDLPGSVGKGRGYKELAGRTTSVEVAEGICVQVLELAALIEIKEELGREKDRAVLPVLKRTLEEKRKGDAGIKDHSPRQALPDNK